MSTDHASKLAGITRLNQLIPYLRDEMGWPIDQNDFEDVDDLFYDFTPEELGLDPKTAAKIESIRRLRPLSPPQPWGIFFVKFEPKRLPVVALRRILAQVAMKKRPGANSADRAAWAKDDLLFVSNYGAGEDRQITFAHFSAAPDDADLPTLRVLGWDNRDTTLHLKAVANDLKQHLAWPHEDADLESWRRGWRGAFSLRHGEVVTTSRQLSVRLARLAGDIRDRIKSALAIETDRGPLTKLMMAFQTSLVHDLDADGFADMYAQTIAYGLLSARIADPHKKTVDDFAGHMRTNPFLRELMETFLKVGGRRGKAGGPGIDFDELGVGDVVQLLDEANMEAVVLDFGDRNPQEDPVIHFYELFLREYDAKKRMARGVFYTPRPIVSCIVRSVDELLRSEFGLQDGLADTATWADVLQRHPGTNIPEGVRLGDPFVQVLDPATGTGTFLVEVIDFIHTKLVAKWELEGLDPDRIVERWNEYVPRDLLPRLHGYELLMAPYAIAHLKIGLKLYATGYRFDSSERARIFLTNALEPASHFADAHVATLFSALGNEARAVNAVKRSQRFTVILGNPPYASTSSNLAPDFRRLVDPYRAVDGKPIRERSMLQFEKNIQDDYVKFVAFAQRRLEEATLGICSLITNHSYLDGPTLRGMRWTLMRDSSSSWFLDLHGNANKAEVAPGGLKDENVFDIRQGVSICALVKSFPPNQSVPQRVRVGDLWGDRVSKYERLLSQSLRELATTAIDPLPPYFFLTRPDTEGYADEWAAWPAVCDIFAKRSTGTETGFDDLLLNFSEAELRDRVETFSSASESRKSLSGSFEFSEGHAATLFSRRQELRTARKEEFRPFQLRAYDYRWALLRKDLLKTNSFSVMLDLQAGSPGLVTTRQTKENFAAFAVKAFCGHKLTSSYDRGYVFPLSTRLEGGLMPRVDSCLTPSTLTAYGYLTGSHASTADLSLDIFNYVLAVLNAPSYSAQFSQRLKRDWPRVPFPGTKEFFCRVSSLGRELAAVQLMESPALDVSVCTYSGPRSPTVARIAYSGGTVWLDAAASAQGHGHAQLGSIGFHGVPEPVWGFKIGGYQVCEKWLKDRRGRTLSKAEVVHYQRIVAALAETIRLNDEIDGVIAQYGGWPAAFGTSEAYATRALFGRAAEPEPPYDAEDRGD